MLNNLHSNTPRKDRKRVGRGIGSGLGKTAGRGHNGQNSRSGGGVRPGFEGGQLPLFQSLPKIGFNNPTRKEYNLVALHTLNLIPEGTVVDKKYLLENKLIKKAKLGVKVLNNGEITKKLTLRVDKISKEAQKAIIKAGGTVEVI